MKAKKYANGGPVDPKRKPVAGKKAVVKKGVSSEYEARREEARKKQEADANLVRRQMEINKRVRMEQNPEAYNKALGTTPQYKQVGGGAQGISTAEIKSGAKGPVGAMTPQAAKRAQSEAMKPPVTVQYTKAPAPALKPGELRPETKAAIERGKGRLSPSQPVLPKRKTYSKGGMLPKRK
jgi:hypothetical protein